MADGTIGYGTTFAIEDDASPQAYVALGEVFNVSPPSFTTDTVDVTHMTSPNRTREFTAGLTDPGECSVEMNFVPGSASDLRILAILALPLSERKKSCKITYPNTKTRTFDGIFTNYEAAVPNEDKMTCTLTMKVTGPVTAA